MVPVDTSEVSLYQQRVRILLLLSDPKWNHLILHIVALCGLLWGFGAGSCVWQPQSCLTPHTMHAVSIIDPTHCLFSKWCVWGLALHVGRGARAMNCTAQRSHRTVHDC